MIAYLITFYLVVALFVGVKDLLKYSDRVRNYKKKFGTLPFKYIVWDWATSFLIVGLFWPILTIVYKNSKN